MDNRQSLIDQIWQGLQQMPRMKLHALLAQTGLPKNTYAKLGDDQSRKLFLGLATRMDDDTLRDVVPLVHA